MPKQTIAYHIGALITFDPTDLSLDEYLRVSDDCEVVVKLKGSFRKLGGLKVRVQVG